MFRAFLQTAHPEDESEEENKENLRKIRKLQENKEDRGNVLILLTGSETLVAALWLTPLKAYIL